MRNPATNTYVTYLLPGKQKAFLVDLGLWQINSAFRTTYSRICTCMQCSVELYTVSVIQTKKRGKGMQRLLFWKEKLSLEFPFYMRDVWWKKYFTLQENWAFVHYIQSAAFFNEIHKLKEEATIPRSATATRAVQNSHVDQTGERFIIVIGNNRFLQASSLLPSPRKTISSFVQV